MQQGILVELGVFTILTEPLDGPLTHYAALAARTTATLTKPHEVGQQETALFGKSFADLKFREVYDCYQMTVAKFAIRRVYYDPCEHMLADASPFIKSDSSVRPTNIFDLMSEPVDRRASKDSADSSRSIEELQIQLSLAVRRLTVVETMELPATFFNGCLPRVQLTVTPLLVSTVHAVIEQTVADSETIERDHPQGASVWYDMARSDESIVCSLEV